MKKLNVLTAGVIAASLTLGGCANMSNAQKGALMGVTGGAVLGAVVAKDKKKGALIGAVGGGLAGGAVGLYMDKQKQDLEKQLAQERDSGAISIEKRDNHVLMVRMTAQTAFDVNSSEIKDGFKSTMDKIAKVVVKYGKTELHVVGHTDSTGSNEANKALSDRRAESVKSYLLGQGVIDDRLSATGKGESEPIASNDNESGRASNRRVELMVTPIMQEGATSNDAG